MSTSICTYLRGAFKGSHEQWLEGTMSSVDAATAAWQPAGAALPIGAHYAHVVTGEDFLFNQLIKGGAAPLMMTVNTGLSEPPAQGDWSGWARRVKVDLSQFRAYAARVYANTDAILAAMSDADLNTVIDLSAMGMGQQPKIMLITQLLQNIVAHTGEISCLMGLQGKRGYPF